MKYSTGSSSRTRFILIVTVLAVIAAAAGFTAGTAANRAAAENVTAKAWVICQKGDYVNLRAKPSTSSRTVGQVDCGDVLELDGTTENGFARVVNLTIDSPAEVWIHTGYIVFDEPRWYGDTMVVVGNAKVAARKCCEGDLRKWLKPDTEVFVYWWTEEWCVTSKGFIKTEYLEVGSV